MAIVLIDAMHGNPTVQPRQIISNECVMQRDITLLILPVNPPEAAVPSRRYLKLLTRALSYDRSIIKDIKTEAKIGLPYTQ